MPTQKQLKELNAYFLKFSRAAESIFGTDGVDLGSFSIYRGKTESKNFYFASGFGQIRINTSNEASQIEYFGPGAPPFDHNIRAINDVSYSEITRALNIAAQALRDNGVDIVNYNESSAAAASMMQGDSARSSGAAAAPQPPKKRQTSIPYPAFSSPAFNALDLPRKQLLVEQDFKEELTNILNPDLLSSEEVLAIADLITILEFVSNQGNVNASIALRKLNFLASTDSIVYTTTDGSEMRLSSGVLKCATPNPQTANFGELLEARMKDLALLIRLLKDKHKDGKGLEDIGFDPLLSVLQKFGDKIGTKSAILEIDEQEEVKRAGHPFIMYRATNGSLCLKFANQEERDEVLKKFRLSVLDDDAQRVFGNNLCGVTPWATGDCKDSIFFPTCEIAGEVAVNFGSKKNTDAFLDLLRFADGKQRTNARGTFMQYSGPDKREICTLRHDSYILCLNRKEIIGPSATGCYSFQPNSDGSVDCVFHATMPEDIKIESAQSSGRFAGGAFQDAKEREDFRKYTAEQDREGGARINAQYQLHCLGVLRNVPSSVVEGAVVSEGAMAKSPGERAPR